MLRKILFLFTVINIFILTGCTKTGKPEYVWPGTEIFFTDTLPAPKLVKTGDFDISGSIMPESPTIFIADCRGNGEPEIIIAGSGQLLIYTPDGNLLSEIKLSHNYYRPAFTADADKDGKQDVIFGSITALKNEIMIMNGMGTILAQFREQNSSHDFSSIAPQGILNEKLYATARPANPEAARGILCLDLFSLRPEWIFYTPTPLGLTPLSINDSNNDLILSYQTDSSGVFSSYGKNSLKPKNDSMYYSIQGMMLRITADGNPVSEKKILNNSQQSLNTLEYTIIPYKKESVLLIHYKPEADLYSPEYTLYEININSGEIITQSRMQHASYLEKVIVPYEKGYLTLISETTAETSAISVFNEELELIKTIDCIKPSRMSHLITNLKKTDFILYYLGNGVLNMLDSSLETKTLLPERDYLNLKIFIYKENPAILLYAEDRIELYTVE